MVDEDVQASKDDLHASKSSVSGKSGFPAHQGNQGNQGKLFYFFPVREKARNLKKMPQIREKSGNFDWPKNRK